MAQNKKTIYTWEGINADGKTLHGEISIENPALIQATLMREGITPKTIKKKRSKLFSTERKKKIKPVNIIAFTEQVATMIKAGLSLTQSLDVLRKCEENNSMQEIIGAISQTLRRGETFADSLRAHPKFFSETYCNLIQIGEASGALETILEQLAVSLTKSQDLKSKVKQALSYPVISLVVALGLAVAMLIWIVPGFKTTFASLGADLPAFTLTVLGVSDFLQANFLYMLVGVVVFIMGFIYLQRKNFAFAYAVDALMLKAPKLGGIIQQVIVAHITRTMATTLSAGLPLLDVLDLIAKAVGNRVYIKAMKEVKEGVSHGESLSNSMRKSNLFPILMLQMILVGEQTGKLDEMMMNTATVYEQRADFALSSISVLIEPFVFLIVGGIVGSILIAMYLPIFSMGQAVGG